MSTLPNGGGCNSTTNKHNEGPTTTRQIKTMIVGCGLGSLSLAVQLLREGQPVLILEKSKELSEVGAGIQMPSNATKVMSDYGLLPKLYEAGMAVRGGAKILRWKDGTIIGATLGYKDDASAGDWAKVKFGNYAHQIHRADYQRVLVEEVRRLGGQIRLDAEVERVERCDILPSVVMKSGERIEGDIVVGGDGLHSKVRTAVLGKAKEARESGDLAYRIVIPKEKLDFEKDELGWDILGGKTVLYWGPNSHVIAYPVRNRTMVNMVMVCPDNLPKDVSRQVGDLAELHERFERWDPKLRSLLKKVDSVLKWKIWDMETLDSWTKGCVTLLGDACHPSVPYAASGAAMAVEDGAVLGKLIGLFAKCSHPKESIPELLQLYEDLRKTRCTNIVQLGDENGRLYHMPDGPEQQRRDQLLLKHDWWEEDVAFPYPFADFHSLKEVYGFDALKSAENGWKESRFGAGETEKYHT